MSSFFKPFSIPLDNNKISQCVPGLMNCSQVSPMASILTSPDVVTCRVNTWISPDNSSWDKQPCPSALSRIDSSIRTKLIRVLEAWPKLFSSGTKGGVISSKCQSVSGFYFSFFARGRKGAKPYGNQCAIYRTHMLQWDNTHKYSISKVTQK